VGSTGGAGTAGRGGGTGSGGATGAAGTGGGAGATGAGGLTGGAGAAGAKGAAGATGAAGASGAAGSGADAGMPPDGGMAAVPCSVDLVASTHHLCARKVDGSLWCWGRNDHGQVGDGTAAPNVPTPVPLSALGTDVAEVAVGYDHSCARKKDGTVWCWGSNERGQLGDGTKTDSPTPVQVAALASGVASIATGWRHSCAVKTDGSVWCWGDRLDGKASADGTYIATTPFALGAPLDTGVAQVSGGDAHTCARKTDGSVYCWGANNYGQLGNGTGTTQPATLTAVVDLAGVAEVRAGFYRSCARKTDGTVWCWGQFTGDGTNVVRIRPVQVSYTTVGFAQLAVGGEVVCAARSDGSLACWGNNQYGQVGTGTASGTLMAPSELTAIADVVQVAAGIDATCARKADSSIWCWGGNRFGELGNGTTAASLVPAPAKICAPTIVPDSGGGNAPPTRNFDFLFLVDNSTQMEPSQAALTAAFPRLVSGLQALPGGLPNIQVAVISSDMGTGVAVPGCTATGNGGAFQYAARAPCTNTTLTAGARFIRNVGGQANYTGALGDVFGCIATLGSMGCGYEQQLSSVSRALGADGMPPPATNQGFLRADADLVVVMVTNEDDCSVHGGAPSPLFAASTTIDTIESPVGPLLSFRCNEFGHLCDEGPPQRRGNLSQTKTYTNCRSNEHSLYLRSVASFVRQLKALKPFPDRQIVVAAIGGVPQAAPAGAIPYSVSWREPPTSDSPWPYVNPACGVRTGTYGDPGVRLAELTKQFGANGILASMCDADYGPVMDAIVQRVAARLGP
jgi:alpha-tubulin suppressor-like RCC1 family protein